MILGEQFGTNLAKFVIYKLKKRKYCTYPVICHVVLGPGPYRWTKCFFWFFPFSLYVGFVPVSDHLGIFCDATFRRSFRPRIPWLKKNEIPSKIFRHPILDENHFTFRPTFFVGWKLFSLLFLVRKLVPPKDIPYHILKSSSLPFYHNCSQDG